jgi:ATP-dependent Clp protease ATP-binding subunit ClpA
MQREIDDRLANLLLEGKIQDGAFVRVDVAGGNDELALEVVSQESHSK